MKRLGKKMKTEEDKFDKYVICRTVNLCHMGKGDLNTHTMGLPVGLLTLWLTV
jgi:hypothetical protein